MTSSTLASSTSPEPVVLAVITARGGSKGIPRKNIAPLGNKPLIAWSIDAALGARSVTRCFVSTDDSEIALVSRAYGAEVPYLRPAELASDTTPHIPVLIQAVEWYEANSETRPDYVLLLQPTSPFRTARDIDAAVALATKKNADSVIGVCEAATHPWLARQVLEDGRLVSLGESASGHASRHSYPKIHAPNGAIYLVRRDVLFTQRTLLTDNTFAYEMPAERSLDIDTPWELYVANLIANNQRSVTFPPGSEATHRVA